MKYEVEERVCVAALAQQYLMFSYVQRLLAMPSIGATTVASTIR